MRGVHQIVLLAFEGPAPLNAPEIDHINGDWTDNRLCNLEYVSHSENVKRANAMRKARMKQGAS